MGDTGPGGAASKDVGKAFAYADETVIARDMRRILLRRCKGLIRYPFVAPVMIDVYAEGAIDWEEKTWFLSQKWQPVASRLETDSGRSEVKAQRRV